MKKLILLTALLFAVSASAQKWEGLADTPPMGWNSWNKFRCDINEKLIMEIADAMVTTGLRDVGYTYVNLDDCWHASTRDKDGFPQCDSVRFPSGMKALADYVHAKGLKLGIYSDAGRLTCGGRFGSYGHEYQDALQYARWGIDYLKYDWCHSELINHVAAYTLMRNALRAAGRPIFFSMCEWGSNRPWEWAKDISHSWRTTGDIWLNFDQNAYVEGRIRTHSVVNIIDRMASLRKYAGPGHWNDPDMLEVGNGFPLNQDRAHFSMWCMFSAPLILGNDIRSMNDQTLALISDPDVIAINQDKLGVQALRHSAKDGVEYWFKPLADGDWALCIFNRNTDDRSCTIDWQTFNFTDTEVSQRATDFAGTTYSVRDLWIGGKPFTTHKPLEVIVPAQDVKLYRLTPEVKKK